MPIRRSQLYHRAPLALLSALVKEPSAVCYQRELAQRAGVSPSSASRILAMFAREGLVRVEKKGNLRLYRPNRDHPLVRQFRVFEVILDLQPLLQKLAPHAERILLFGSAAQGLDDEESDIDLFVQSPEPERVRGICAGARVSGRDVRVVAMDRVEWAELRERQPLFYDKIRHGVVLKDE